MIVFGRTEKPSEDFFRVLPITVERFDQMTAKYLATGAAASEDCFGRPLARLNSMALEERNGQKRNFIDRICLASLQMTDKLTVYWIIGHLEFEKANSNILKVPVVYGA